jgi:hypothetical protein
MNRYNKSPFTSATQYYVANFVPAALKIPGVKNNIPSTIIASENPEEPHIPGVSIEYEMKIYNANKGLDFDHDGNITLGDLDHVLKNVRNQSKYKEAVSKVDSFKEEPETKSEFSLESLLDSFLNKISFVSNKYNNFQEENNYLISLSKANLVDQVEFARVLHNVLNEEMKINANIKLKDNVHIECKIHGPNLETYMALKEILNETNKCFNSVNKNAKVISSIEIEKTSSYPELKLSAALKYYDSFLTKLGESKW